MIEVKNDHLARLLTTIVHGQIRAAYRLIAVVNDESTPPSVWLRAAGMLLAYDVVKLDGHVSGAPA